MFPYVDLHGKLAHATGQFAVDCALICNDSVVVKVS
jgi:hypothetical protein